MKFRISFRRRPSLKDRIDAYLNQPNTPDYGQPVYGQDGMSIVGWMPAKKATRT